MIRRIILVSFLLFISHASFGEFNEDFSSYESIDDIPENWKIGGQDQKIIKDGDNSILLVYNTPDDGPSNIKMPTGLDTRNLKATFDWKTTKKTGGYIFRLSDWNHNKFIYTISLNGSKIVAIIFNKKGRKKTRRLFSPKMDTWYRFELVSKEDDLSFTVKITERNAENTEDVELAYDSVESEQELTIHKSNPVKVIFLSIWPVQVKAKYFYDNISLVEQD